MHYPVNEAMRVGADFVPYEPPRPVSIMDIAGNVYEEECPGYVVFNLAGQKCCLDADGLDDKGLFFNFRDEPYKVEACLGGRFLATRPLADGKGVLDFKQRL